MQQSHLSQTERVYCSHRFQLKKQTLRRREVIHNLALFCLLCTVFLDVFYFWFPGHNLYVSFSLLCTFVNTACWYRYTWKKVLQARKNFQEAYLSLLIDRDPS